MKNYQYKSITITDDQLPADEQLVSINTDCNTNDHPEDHLAPPFDSNERPSNLFVGTFNLIATIVGKVRVCIVLCFLI